MQDISEDCISTDDFTEMEVNLYRNTVEKGFKKVWYPRSAIGGCGSLFIKSYIIDPLGDIFKCMLTIGNKVEKIGNVMVPLEYSYNYIKWLSWDPLSYDKCKNCQFLPVCMGGCFRKILYNHLPLSSQESGPRGELIQRHRSINVRETGKNNTD